MLILSFLLSFTSLVTHFACVFVNQLYSWFYNFIECKIIKDPRFLLTFCFFLKGVFAEVVGGKRKKHVEEEDNANPTSKKNRETGRDEEFYIPYRPKDFDSERGYVQRHSLYRFLYYIYFGFPLFILGCICLHGSGHVYANIPLAQEKYPSHQYVLLLHFPWLKFCLFLVVIVQFQGHEPDENP